MARKALPSNELTLKITGGYGYPDSRHISVIINGRPLIRSVSIDDILKKEGCLQELAEKFKNDAFTLSDFLSPWYIEFYNLLERLDMESLLRALLPKSKYSNYFSPDVIDIISTYVHGEPPVIDENAQAIIDHIGKTFAGNLSSRVLNLLLEVDLFGYEETEINRLSYELAEFIDSLSRREVVGSITISNSDNNENILPYLLTACERLGFTIKTSTLVITNKKQGFNAGVLARLLRIFPDIDPNIFLDSMCLRGASFISSYGAGGVYFVKGFDDWCRVINPSLREKTLGIIETTSGKDLEKYGYSKRYLTAKVYLRICAVGIADLLKTDPDKLISYVVAAAVITYISLAVKTFNSPSAANTICLVLLAGAFLCSEADPAKTLSKVVNRADSEFWSIVRRAGKSMQQPESYRHESKLN